MSVGVLGKLVKKKKEAQRHLAIDSTLGYKTADVEDNRTTTGGGAVNLSDMKRQLRQHKADKEQKESMARGYELATSTVSARAPLPVCSIRAECLTHLRPDPLRMVGACGVDRPRDAP